MQPTKAYKKATAALYAISIKQVVMLSAIALSVSCAGCSDDNDDSPGNKQIIPLAKANTWIYVDSTFLGTNLTVKYDTVQITGNRTSNGYVWWAFSKAFNPETGVIEYAEKNGMIYGIQHTDSPKGTTEVISTEYVPAPASDTTIYQSLYDGDTQLYKTTENVKTPVTIPAGKFESYYAYTYNIFPYYIHEYVRPGYGLLRLEKHYMVSVDGIPFWYSRTLVSLKIN